MRICSSCTEQRCNRLDLSCANRDSISRSRRSCIFDCRRVPRVKRCDLGNFSTRPIAHCNKSYVFVMTGSSLKPFSAEIGISIFHSREWDVKEKANRVFERSTNPAGQLSPLAVTFVATPVTGLGFPWSPGGIGPSSFACGIRRPHSSHRLLNNSHSHSERARNTHANVVVGVRRIVPVAVRGTAVLWIVVERAAPETTRRLDLCTDGNGTHDAVWRSNIVEELCADL